MKEEIKRRIETQGNSTRRSYLSTKLMLKEMKIE